MADVEEEVLYLLAAFLSPALRSEKRAFQFLYIFFPFSFSNFFFPACIFISCVHINFMSAYLPPLFCLIDFNLSCTRCCPLRHCLLHHCYHHLCANIPITTSPPLPPPRRNG